LEIAQRLMKRAEHIAQHARSIQKAVYGAALALDAKEYLGHKTPTTSLEALALQHKLEVTAECMFYGVVYNLNVKKRLKEIRREVHSIGNWLEKKTRKRSELDAMVGIVGELVLSFREHYQFDEEQYCLNRLRRLHRGIWFQKRLYGSKPKTNPKTGRLRIAWNFTQRWARRLTVPVWGPVLLLIWACRLYLDLLLNSLKIFLLAIVLWVAGLSVAYEQFCDKCDVRDVVAQSQTADSAPAADGATKHVRYEHGINHAMTSFFGIQPPHDLDDLEGYGYGPFIITIIAITMGFVHLGIFVSHVYSLVSRR
jgi:hypothetical protein